MDSDVIVVIVVATALAFDFTNGFHDTANVVATSISTRAMSPRLAVSYAAVLNFVGAFLSLEVAATVANDVVNPAAITLLAIFAGLVGAIAWNLITWYFGLPSSSSHALIGGIVGAVLVASGPERRVLRQRDPRQGDDPGARRAPARVRGGRAGDPAALPHRRRAAARARHPRLPRRPGDLRRAARPGPRHERRPEDHGRDHARAGGQRHIAANNFHVPTWVVASSATAISLGTYVGGWRIIKTMGSRIHKMDSAQGFAAQGSGAAVILASSHVGFPLSTTQTISGAVIGSGAAKRLSAVRWGVAGNIVAAWIVTLPAAAAIGALTYGITRPFGTGAAGPIVVSALILGAAGLLLIRRAQQGPASSAAAEA